VDHHAGAFPSAELPNFLPITGVSYGHAMLTRGIFPYLTPSETAKRENTAIEVVSAVEPGECFLCHGANDAGKAGVSQVNAAGR